jgi:WD repeat and SOF domain-containing protein 1
MDVAYSPTGKEIVSGSYDRTIRIFNVRAAKSREVYHAKRMQRCVSPCPSLPRRSSPPAHAVLCPCSESSRSSSAPTPISCSPAQTTRTFASGRPKRPRASPRCVPGSRSGSFSGLRGHSRASSVVGFWTQAAPRERRKLEYQESLKERYQHLREISRIAKYVVPSTARLCVCVLGC